MKRIICCILILLVLWAQWDTWSALLWPLLSGWLSFTPSLLLDIAAILAVITMIVCLCLRCRKREMFVLLWRDLPYLLLALGIYIIARSHEQHSYHFTRSYFLPCIALADALAIVYVAFIVCGIVRRIKSRQRKTAEANQLQALPDTPIENSDEDRFSFSDIIKQVKQVMEQGALSEHRSYSIAITAPWGCGKTSFMNLLKGELDPQRWITIDFNPRASHHADDIQADFLNQLSEALSIYYPRFSRLIDKYIHLLGLSKTTAPLLALYNLFHRHSSEELRSDIIDIIRLTGKRLAVFIDDLDRLERDEMIEVFKLIDKNASFPHTVFVSGYDKGYLHRTLEKLSDKDTPFEHKYFQKEFALILTGPQLLGYFRKLISRYPRIPKFTKNEKGKEIEDIGFVRTNLHDPRDVKKYVNLLQAIDQDLWNDIVPLELAKVTLLKMKYADEYQKLLTKALLTVVETTNPAETKKTKVYLLKHDFKNGLDKDAVALLQPVFQQASDNLQNNKTIADTIAKQEPKSIQISTNFHRYFIMDSHDFRKKWKQEKQAAAKKTK